MGKNMNVEQKELSQFNQQRLQELEDLFGGYWPSRISEELLVSRLTEDENFLRQALSTKDHFISTINALGKIVTPIWDECPLAGKAVADFTVRNIPLIEEGLEKDSARRLPAMRLVGRVVRFGDDIQKQHLCEYLATNFLPTIQAEKLKAFEYSIFLSRIYNYSSNPQIQLSNIVARAFNSQDEDVVNCIPDLLFKIYDNFSKTDRQYGVEVIQKALASFGLDAGLLIKAWEDCSASSLSISNWTFDATFTRNLESILFLERQIPGVTGRLQREFGIANFLRYPPEILLQQDRQRDNNQIPYGVIIYPKADHNGGFSEDQDVFAKLWEQANQIEYTIRVAEADSKLSLVSILNRFRKRYGKIAFAVIGGHGKPDSIRIGIDKKKGLIRTEDVLRPAVLAFRHAFDQHPTIILAACSTGAIKGIGQMISELGATVIAPDIPTSLKGIFVELLNNSLQFRVSYRNARDAQVYYPTETTH